MLRTKVCGAVVLLTGIVLSACSHNSADQNAKIEADELVFATDPEPVKGKTDVYTSMARTVKYNVDVAAHNLRKKIREVNPKLRADDIIKNVLNTDIQNENKLYRAAKVLDFAVIYAVANASNNQVYVDNYFYETSSRHLALAAIRAHQAAWFGAKKGKELERLARQEGKVVENLDDKEKRTGILTQAENDYRKNQKVQLLKLAELNRNLAFAVAEYADLTKAEPAKVELEGRSFYELEDFDRNYSIELFQEAAVRNRKEFALAKEQIRSYAVADLRHDIITQYPLVASLDINGLKVENVVYEQELYDKVMMIARNLIEAANTYKLASEGSGSQQIAKIRLFDELGAAVLTQSELNYQLVKLADANLDDALRAQVALKKEIRQMEKIYHPESKDKLALLNAKITMAELEKTIAEIKAERAVALRSLYFGAGLSPFNKMLLKGKIADIAQALKQAFNQNLVDMLATVKGQLKARPQDAERGWAQRPNWLEEAVAAQPRPKAKATVKPGAYKVMQLGAYEFPEHAAEDWADLSARFPELKAYPHKVEKAVVNGRLWYRLVVEGDSAALEAGCRRLQSSGADCLLR